MANPTLLLLDLDNVSQVIYRTAHAVALDANTSIAWKEDRSSSGKVISWAGWTARVIVFPVGIYNKVTTGSVYEGPGAAEVETNRKRVESQAAQFSAMYSRQFAAACKAGPAKTVAFFEEMNSKRVAAAKSLQRTFREAKEINDEVIRQLDVAIRRTDTVEVACAAGVTVGLSFVAAPVWVLTLAGVGYGVTIDLVKTVAGARSASAMGYVEKHGKSTGIGATVNQAQSSAARHLVKATEAAVKQNEQALADKVARYASQGGGKIRQLPGGGTAKLTGKQWKIVRRMGQKNLQAQEQNAARQGLAKWGGGGAAAGIGLFFMRDDLARAFRNIKAEFE